MPARLPRRNRALAPARPFVIVRATFSPPPESASHAGTGGYLFSGIGMASTEKRAGGMDISQAQTMWGAFSRILVAGISLVVVILIMMAFFLV